MSDVDLERRHPSVEVDGRSNMSPWPLHAARGEATLAASSASAQTMGLGYAWPVMPDALAGVSATP